MNFINSNSKIFENINVKRRKRGDSMETLYNSDNIDEIINNLNNLHIKSNSEMLSNLTDKINNLEKKMVSIDRLCIKIDTLEKKIDKISNEKDYVIDGLKDDIFNLKTEMRENTDEYRRDKSSDHYC